jgi:hypothetical protein
MADIPEADWKTLRELRPVALDRLCARILAEVEELVGDGSRSNHERYLALFRLLDDRSEDVARAFDGLSRGNAFLRLLGIVSQDLLTEDELARFGPETRERVTGAFRRDG